MKDLLSVLCSYLQQGRPLAMATVVRRHGSAPREPGARLLANERGLVYGTVGGGLLEAMALKACTEAMNSGQCRVLSVDMSGELAANADMVCGGDMCVLVEPLRPDAETLAMYQTMRHCMESGGSLLVKGLEQNLGLSLLVTKKECLGNAPEAVREMARLLLHKGLSCPGIHHCANGEFYVEPLLPPSRMIIAGGGHVAVAVARIAALTGFEVTVLDDREEYAAPSRFPWAAQTLVVPDFNNCFDSLVQDVHTFVVITTRGHVHDGHVLAQALPLQAGYIGMIGSVRKRDQVYGQMFEQGFSEADLARVHCPIGLPIEAETPEEIALSIVAECVGVKRKRMRNLA